MSARNPARTIVKDPPVHSRKWKQRRHEQILAAAFEEFSAKGFAEARLDDVAERAGIAKGTIYLYFKSKDLLFRAVLRGLIHHVLEELGLFVRTFQGSAEDLVRNVLSLQYTQVVANPKARAMLRLLIAESHKFPRLSDIYLREIIEPGMAAMRLLLKKGVASGEFRETKMAEFPQVLVGPAILAIVWTLILGDRKRLDLDAYREAHLELLLRGLRKAKLARQAIRKVLSAKGTSDEGESAPRRGGDGFSFAGAGSGYAQGPSPQRLTLDDAIALALKNNLNVRVANTQVGEAEGTRERQRAPLLPRVTGDSLVNEQNRNLAAFGITVPGIPTVVGPFTYMDFRVFASENLVDRRSYHNWKASRDTVQASQLDYQDARDLVIRQTAGLYLDAQADLAEVQAAESRVATSEALEKLARDQHANQLATGVDVARAQVQLARNRQTLLVAQDAYQTSLLVLARFLGLRPGTPLELVEQLTFKHVEKPELDPAVHAALDARPDYRSLLSQRDSLAEQEKASRARYYPTVTVGGDYGALGRNFDSLPGIGEAQATLSITLFDRDRQGEREQLQSRLQRLGEQMDDLARGIEQDIRKAVLDLDSTEQQVNVTQQGLDLAQLELKLAEDRFRNGVTDNIEVVTAQAALAASQDDLITALARHADAAAALARALGATEQHYRMYLGASIDKPPVEARGGGGKQP